MEAKTPKIDTAKIRVEVEIGPGITSLPTIEEVRQKIAESQIIMMDPEYATGGPGYGKGKDPMDAQFIQALRNEGVEFYPLAVEDSRLPENSITTVRMINVLNRVENPEVILKEAVRIVKPGTEGGEIYVAADNTADLYPLENVEGFAKSHSLHCEVLTFEYRGDKAFREHTHDREARGVRFQKEDRYLVRLRK